MKLKILTDIKRRLNNPKLLKRDVKFFWQRQIRGFDDGETFSLDYSLAQAILPRLQRFKEVTAGTPSDLDEVAWQAILDKMIAAFEFAGSEERWNAEPSAFILHQEGIDLFAKHYFSLWW